MEITTDYLFKLIGFQQVKITMQEEVKQNLEIEIKELQEQINKLESKVKNKSII